MNFRALIGPTRHFLKANSPLIFSAVAGVGTIATAYLTGKASYKAAGVIQKHEEEHGRAVDRKQRVKERTKLVWRLYIPAGMSAVSTIACIVGANRVSAKKVLASQALLAISEQRFGEYRDKVVEEFSTHKDKSIRDKVAEDKVKNNPAPAELVAIQGPGQVMCCELFTQRYFISDMESLRRAQNDLNALLLGQGYATLEDFYYFVGLKPTSLSNKMGWEPEKQMELQFSTVLSSDDKPCLAFDYNYVKPL